MLGDGLRRRPCAPEAGRRSLRGARRCCGAYHQAVELVGKRWTGAILFVLMDGPLRFSEVKRARARPLRPAAVRAHEGARGRGDRRAPRDRRHARPGRVRAHREGRALEPAVRALKVWARTWLYAPRQPASTSRTRPTRRSSMADQPQTADDVKAFVEDRDIRFIRLWFTDILGQLKSFSINAEELDDAFEGGMGFDGSSITGFNAIEESDMIAMPDPSTFAVLPWRPEDQGVARMFCDVVTPSREPYEGDPRHVLRRALERARVDGLRRPSTSARSSSSSTSGTRSPRAGQPGDPRRGRLLRPHDARRRLRRAPRDGARARAARHPRGVHPPRGRARRSTRSTCATPTR